MKVGDYVRNKKGEIGKVVYFKPKGEHKYDFERYMLDINKWNRRTIDIVKSSPNIIDLIEENDIVNHSRVVCIGVSTDLSGTHKYLVLENGSNCANENIKSILTKEMFEQMEYKIQ